MSMELCTKGSFAVIFGLAFAWIVFYRYDREVGYESTGKDGQRYLPIVNGALLPSFFLLLIPINLLFDGMEPTIKMVLTMCVDIFLHISIYYVILIMLLPFLRRHISARACAMLWLMPNYLYLTQYMEVPAPLVTIHVPSQLVAVVFKIWLAGMISVLMWNIAEHLIFRRKVLKNAVPLTDIDILNIFQKELEDMAIIKPKFRIVTSDAVTVPLTIGLFGRSTRIVLPDKFYTEQELQLIFRHELVHISREDSWAKFFMMFCTAMCWFNPLMWLAMRKSAEDMELSCDETVLLNADETTRKQYASLILDTAGDDRGFSTCMASSVSAMRYRLKSIIKPNKRRTGALVVGLTFFILCMTCGYVSLAYGEDTGTTTVFRNHPLTDFTADDITVTGGGYENGVDNVDTDALTQYIASLPTQQMTGNYSFNDDEKNVHIWYNSPYGVVIADLYTDYIKVLYFADENNGWNVYHLPQSTDWEYVDSIVPPIPAANVKLSDGTEYGGSHLNASVIRLIRENEGQSTVLKDKSLNPYENAGIFGSSLYLEYIDVTVSFSMPMISKAEVLIENWDCSSSDTLTLEPTEDSITFDMPDYPAHYTISASFQGSNGVYDTTFAFNIGDADSI